MTARSRCSPTRSRRSTTTASRRPTPTATRTTWSPTPSAQVQEGAVEADEGGGENLADSTALNGSNTNNGTRGFTTGPDLQFVQIRASQNQIAYVFDQEVVDPVNSNADNLGEGARRSAASRSQPGLRVVQVHRPAGEDHYSLGASVASFPGDGRERVVVAQFDDSGTGFTDDVTDAVIAVAEPGAVASRTGGEPAQRPVRGHGPRHLGRHQRPRPGLDRAGRRR